MVFNPIEYTVVEDPVDIDVIVELVTPTERQLTITLNISAGSAQGATASICMQLSLLCYVNTLIFKDLQL